MQESNDMINPYYNSLVGLKLKDPVEAFFNFCKERENIRSLRENGEPFPWTKDLIFQRGRFLNVFSCLLYTSPSPRDATLSRMPSSA